MTERKAASLDEEKFLLSFLARCHLESFPREDGKGCADCWFDKFCPAKMYHPEEKCSRFWKNIYAAEDGRKIPLVIRPDGTIDLDIDRTEFPEDSKT